MGMVVSDLADTKLTPEQFASVTMKMLEDATPGEAAEYKLKVQKAMATAGDEGVHAEQKAYIQALATALGFC